MKLTFFAGFMVAYLMAFIKLMKIAILLSQLQGLERIILCCGGFTKQHYKNLVCGNFKSSGFNTVWNKTRNWNFLGTGSPVLQASLFAIASHITEHYYTPWELSVLKRESMLICK